MKEPYTDLAKLEEHPVVRAWSQLGLPGRPKSVEKLATLKGSVYRMHELGSLFSTVIAKCGPRENMLIERFAYRDLMPGIGVTALQYYGFLEEEGNKCWLFLEDACGEEFDESNPEHIVLASEWVALMHARTASRSLGAHLANRKTETYLESIIEARRLISHTLENCKIPEADVGVLETIISHCNALEHRWGEIASFCDAFPKCLLHGDFINKNMRVRSTGGRRALYVLDWERASWSMPLEDIAGLDMHIYWPIVRETWPQLDLSTARRASNIGAILRYSEWIHGYSTSFPYNIEKDDNDDNLEGLRYCEAELAAARRNEGW